MRLLVIGGTVFVGRAVVEAALARGHDVTVFHRGEHGEDTLPPQVAHVHGDRRTGLDAVSTTAWDAVVDTSGFSAEDARAAVEALGERVGHYTFVSSVSVYRDWPAQPASDTAAVYADDAPAGYGEDKARAERVVLSAYGDNALVARPGLIVGPHENIGRLPFWLRRIAQGGEVLAPGRPDEPRQWVDARDLAEWTVSMAERGRGGTHAVVSPPGGFTMGELLDACRDVTGSVATFRWVPGDRVAAAGITPWAELPIWNWDANGSDAHTWDVDVSGALAAGFIARPVRETVADTWAWVADGDEDTGYRSEYAVRPLDPQREAAALAGGCG